MVGWSPPLSFQGHFPLSLPITAPGDKTYRPSVGTGVPSYLLGFVHVEMMEKALRGAVYSFCMVMSKAIP